MITDINQLDLEKHYTYADYLTWQFDDMVELIRGKIFKMSPTPSRKHQQVSSKLLKSIFLRPTLGNCQVFHAPFDVRLPLPDAKQKAGNTVVQPDICVVCDPSKLDDQGCNGAPDWIIEILSPGTAQKDLNEKYQLYQNAGVREYWIVHPLDQTVLVYLLNDQREYLLHRQRPFSKEESVPVGIFEGFEVDLETVFE